MKLYHSYPVFFISEFLKHYKIEHFFTKFQLLKFVLITFVLGFLTSIIIVGSELNLFNISETFFYYVFSFWKSNILFLCAVFLIFFILFSNAFRGQFKLSVQYNTKPLILDPHVEDVFGKINRVLLIITLIYSIVFVIPVIQLTNTKFIALATPIFGVIISIAIRLLMRKKEKDSNKSPLNELKFNKISYNSASIGNISDSVQDEINSFNKDYKPNPFNNRILDYFNGTFSSNFKGYKAIFEELVKIVNPELQNGILNSIVIRERTTDAISKILDGVINPSKKTYIISSDGEYPEVITTIKGLISENHFIEVEDSLIDGTYSENEFADKIISKTKDELINNDYVIILFSHIYYKTGTVVQAEKVFNKLNESFSEAELMKLIYICDGAQAVGNIKIPLSLLDITHFYVFGGHKWLMSMPNIGFAINNKILIEKCQLDFKKFMYTNRAFSTYSYNTSEYKGTIDPYPYISLYMSLVDLNRAGIRAIEEHNNFLSEYFKDCVKTTLFKTKPLIQLSTGGLATIISDNPSEMNDYLLNRYNNSSGFLVDEKQKLIRFSFHYNMGVKHVNRLVYAMMEYEKSTAHNKV